MEVFFFWIPWTLLQTVVGSKALYLGDVGAQGPGFLGSLVAWKQLRGDFFGLATVDASTTVG